ncbi:hypothetical protein OBBRIDRAFT_137503 [Obba rivulosa]|uniref:Ribosome assembly protein 3 n=1 Tax=Obba rivulosa TaxID=1052685 RepID=A0A8E2AQU1_9APHY|nr:hypothetical protein OBBRIDRAFT_137503 [Obba rivulosa]
MAAADPARRPAPATAPSAARRSPTPPPAQIPSFLAPEGAPDDSAPNERALKERFRQFWMSSVVDAFADDLEEIRKEPNLTPSRLSLLIDSLASGAEVFSGAGGVGEMEVVLEQHEET